MGASAQQEIVARIYEAAFDGALWPVVLADIAGEIGAEHIFLGIHHALQGATSIAPLTDPAQLDDYNRHWVAKNPCARAMVEAPLGRVFHTPGELVDGESYRRSEIFNEWCRAGDMGYGALCVALNRNHVHHAFTAAYKPWGVDSFEEDEQRFYGSVVDHLARAIELQRRVLDLREMQLAAASAIAVLDDGIVVVDAAANVIFAGGSAEEIFSRTGDQLILGAPFPVPSVLDRVVRLVATCADQGSQRPGGALVVPRPGQSDLRLGILPVPANQRQQLAVDPAAQAAAVITLDDPDLKAERLAARLAGLYGLTPAEVRFAMQIARGDGKRLAAERCGISYATARAHLSSIFEKTGVHRQAELVRLLMRGR